MIINRKSMKINKKILEDLVKKIRFDKNCIEATFQFRLLMEIAATIDKNKIFPESNIKNHGLEKRDFIKKEIDIVVEEGGEKCERVAIELKMPMKGQVPEQMYKFVKDIRFLEQLKSGGDFTLCFLIVVTNDDSFWEGGREGIYHYFRDESKVLSGEIFKPTGKGKNEESYTLSGEYRIEWKEAGETATGFKYFIVEVNPIARS